MDRKTREELNGLSLKVFGTSSRWYKLVNDGYPQKYEKDREVLIPGLNGSLDPTVFTDKKTAWKYMTVDEVRKYMVTELKRREDIKPAIDAIDNGPKDGSEG